MQEEEYAQYNVFIFNFTKNNEQDVARLKQTFARQNCWVKVHQRKQLTYAAFKKAVEYIKKSDFTLYEYIVIVVLDQYNRYQHLLRSKDNQDIYLNDELLTSVKRNRTLANKKRLYFIQINQNVIKDHKYQSCKSEVPGFLYAGPTITLSAQETGRVRNYWPTPTADESPFVKAFCDNFDRWAETMNIADIHERILTDMRCMDCQDKPCIAENVTASEPCIFGKALTKSCIRDFFYNHKDYDSHLR